MMKQYPISFSIIYYFNNKNKKNKNKKLTDKEKE